MLTRPEGISGAELAVDWSGGVDPPRPPDYDMELEGPRPLRYFDLHQVRPPPTNHSTQTTAWSATHEQNPLPHSPRAIAAQCCPAQSKSR